MSIGERIKAARERVGLSGSELAERMGVTKGAVSNWETGRSDPKPDSMVDLAKATGCNLHWILTGRGPQVFESGPYDSDRYNMARLLRHVADAFESGRVFDLAAAPLAATVRLDSGEGSE